MLLSRSWRLSFAMPKETEEMRYPSLLPLTVLGLSFIAVPAPAADKADGRIDKLVEQLGNDDFNEREKASAALDAVGEPALDALRRAVKSTDEEVHKRAETLVGKIEKRLETANALKAKRVHLVFKGASLNEALLDFEKQSGYHFTLIGSESEFASRKVTLDTGDAPFWQALDQFCDQAGLKEIEAREQKPTPEPLPAAVSEQVFLINGNAETRPTDAASAIRIRIPPKTGRSDAPQTGDIPFTLQLSLEPRLRWVAVERVVITKAVDDQKQELTQAADPLPAAPPPLGVGPAAGFAGGIAPAIPANPGARSLHQDAGFRLKEGEKYSKSLTELSGTVTASILTESAPIITAPDILKAAGKTFKGGDNGQIKVVEVAKDENGRITIRMELQAPADVVAAPGLIGRGAMRRLGRGVPVAVAAAGAGGPPGGFVAVRGAVFVGGVGNSANGLSLLDDKGETVKLTGVQMQFTPVVAGPAGIVNSLQHVLTFQAEKGQEPAKLVYSGRKSLNVEIPFTLKDVPLP
jgi:hypothetical protein